MALSRTSKHLAIPVLATLALAGIWALQDGGGLPAAQASRASDFDVTSYGAVGDGSADDTSAIQSAINAAQAAGGGIVFVPQGDYKVTSTLTVTGKNVTIEGTGKASSIFRSGSTGAVLKIGHATDMTQTTHNKVKNISVDRAVAPSSNSYGIFVERARFTSIEGVTVYNAGYGIAVGPQGVGGIPNQFTNIMDSWIMRSGSRLTESTFPDSGIMFFSGADHKVSNTFIEPSNRGLVMTGNSNGILMEQVSIINGAPYNYGLVSDGTGFARYFNNGIIENALHQQVYVGGASERFTLSNSWIGAGDLNGTTRVGVQIEPGARLVTIANNRIGDQRREGLISRGDEVMITGNTLEGNANSNCACDSLLVEGGTHVTINANRVQSSADRFGVGLYNDGGRVLNNYIYTDNNTSGSGSGYNNTATGGTKVISDNLN